LTALLMSSRSILMSSRLADADLSFSPRQNNTKAPVLATPEPGAAEAGPNPALAPARGPPASRGDVTA
jgi:hypothetical protein